MPNLFYASTKKPGTRGVLSSADIRQQFDLIESAFDKLPPAAVTFSGFSGGLWQFGTFDTGVLQNSILGSTARPSYGTVFALGFTADILVPGFTGLGVGRSAIGSSANHVRGIVVGTAPDAVTLASIRMIFDQLGNVVVGNGTAALATTATNGFLHVPTCAGLPTGVPTLFTGVKPIVFDTTNLKICVYTGGVWIKTAALT